jgi:hypothetical protein
MPLPSQAGATYRSPRAIPGCNQGKWRAKVSGDVSGCSLVEVPDVPSTLIGRNSGEALVSNRKPNSMDRR